jgi:cellulose synthase/poly-beta-1,6-N-acetylglucosamine synthase-like glycosyltransferase
VLVIDADTVVDAGLVEEVQRRLTQGGLALQSRYELSASQDQPRTKLTALAFHAFNAIRPRGRSRLGLSAGILGNGFALHREVLNRIPYNAHSVVEDLEYHLALVLANIRVEFIDTSAVRSEVPVAAGSAKTQRARWEGGRFRVMRQWAFRLLIEVVRGRTRLIEPLLDLLALPIALEVLLLLLAACLPLIWLKLYVLTAFGVLLFHVTVAAASGPGLRATMEALAYVPGYILWKIRIFPEIWRASRANAVWVSTKREAPVEAAAD